jgi:RNA polymerase sigma factor (sigma-70 family)
MASPADVFEQHLDEINRIVAYVCKRNHLAPQDCDDFRQQVHLKLLEDDCAVLGKFEGRSSLSTYLTTVIQRIFSQHRVHLWGKWRPSAEAKRLGDKAITIERMTTRDDYTLHETINILTTHAGATFTRAQIEALYVRLPPRQPRPILVADNAIPEVESAGAADDDVMQKHREYTARAMAKAMEPAIEKMDPEDRVILKMRFWHAAKVPDIAAALHLDQKKLYKRIEKLSATLGETLQRAGFGRDDAAELLAHGDHNLTLRLEKRNRRPSNGADGNSVRAQAGGRGDHAD